MLQPDAVEANRPSSLHLAQQAADMIIVSHADFAPALAPLVSLRRSQGLAVKVVDVADIYDEFNFGRPGPYAIKAFLSAAASTWTTKPRWVLLVGDATYDPRGYLGTGRANYLPVQLIGTRQLETVSDDWFVDFDDDGLPDIAIGRLPVDDSATAAALVNKIVAYENAGAAGWKSRALLVSGADDAYDAFENSTSALPSLLPASMAVTTILQGRSANPSADFLDAFNSGQGLVNYIGHGSTEIWKGNLFTSAAAGTLTNGSATPFVISMTCLNGYFQDVYTFSLAKALLEAPGGGAVAVWASSSLTDAAPQSVLNRSMIKALYGAAPITVGEAAMAAKASVPDRDVRRTWILFGDPAMSIR